MHRHYFVIKYKDALKAQTALALDHTELMGKMIRVTKGKPSPALVAAVDALCICQLPFILFAINSLCSDAVCIRYSRPVSILSPKLQHQWQPKLMFVYTVMR